MTQFVCSVISIHCVYCRNNVCKLAVKYYHEAIAGRLGSASSSRSYLVDSDAKFSVVCSHRRRQPMSLTRHDIFCTLLFAGCAYLAIYAWSALVGRFTIALGTTRARSTCSQYLSNPGCLTNQNSHLNTYPRTASNPVSGSW